VLFQFQKTPDVILIADFHGRFAVISKKVIDSGRLGTGF
jgi:hypothetical protein